VTHTTRCEPAGRKLQEATTDSLDAAANGADSYSHGTMIS